MGHGEREMGDCEHNRGDGERDMSCGGLSATSRQWLVPAVVAIAFYAGAPAAPWFGAPALANQDARVADPRADDPTFRRSQQLFEALRETLDDAAQERLNRQVDPDSPVSDFVWRQFGVDQQTRISELLGSAFELMTDAPVVDMQRQIAQSRAEIDVLRDQVAELREQRIVAPVDGGWSSWLGASEDQRTLTDQINDLLRDIGDAEAEIEAQKEAFGAAMTAAGAPLSQEQVDLLLESVTGSDMVELAAAYEAVRGVSAHLRQLMDESGEDLTYARRYYGMHTALIALLVEAQTRFLSQVDREYLPKLSAIESDIDAAARETRRLMRDDPTRDQARALEANAASQNIARDALRLYRSYLKRQRLIIADLRRKTVKELRVADNTLRTVDASFQLREVMESASTSFEALRSLESPGFERLFRNEQLRREFKELTDRLGPGS